MRREGERGGGEREREREGERGGGREGERERGREGERERDSIIMRNPIIVTAALYM